MEPESKKPSFSMTEPADHQTSTRYAFWLKTEETRLFRFVRSLLCVADVQKVTVNTALIGIKDEYDADEAWHYIRTEIEEEASYVHLDKIWEDALMWL